jgi:hypothetical protein
VFNAGLWQKRMNPTEGIQKVTEPTETNTADSAAQKVRAQQSLGNADGAFEADHEREPESAASRTSAQDGFADAAT